MKKYFLYMFLCITSISVMTRIVYADNLGRIFTTAEERQQLEKIRKNKIESVKTEVVELKKEQEVVEVRKEVVIRDPIALKGLVHRSDGKNTAWVNETNTFEGNLDSEFIQVSDKEIKSDQVTIILSDDSTQIDLRVGDVFIPEPIEKELVETPDTVDD